MANTCRHPIDKVKVLTLADPMVQWCTLCGATRFITGTFGQAAKSPRWRSPKLAKESSLSSISTNLVMVGSGMGSIPMEGDQ